MLVYVKGQTMVKGIPNSNVYYVGDLQDDGYIYFNDDMFYRVPTPDNISESGQEISVSSVQVWYTVRNCWVNANRFTNLTVYTFDPEEIQGLAERIEDLEDKISNVIVPAINTLGQDSLGDNSSYGYGNGDSLLYLFNKLIEVVNWCNSEGASITVNSRTIFTNWNDIS